jgi:hypothetical protein
MIKMRCRICKLLFVGRDEREAEVLYDKHKCIRDLDQLSDKELLHIIVSGKVDSWHTEVL